MRGLGWGWGGGEGIGMGGGGVYLVPSSLPSSNLCILITACLSRFTIYLYDRTSHVREITFFQHYVTLVTNDIISIWKINMIHVYSLQYLRYSLMNTPDQYQTIKPVLPDCIDTVMQFQTKVLRYACSTET